jgi:hypothetical protein
MKSTVHSKKSEHDENISEVLWGVHRSNREIMEEVRGEGRN